MSDPYWLITSDEDGDIRVYGPWTDANVLCHIQEQTENVRPSYHPVFLTSKPNCDPNQWPANSQLLIQGKVVVPKPVKIVTEYEL